MITRETFATRGVFRVTTALKNFDDYSNIRNDALTMLGLLSKAEPSLITPSIPVILDILRNYMYDYETLKLACVSLADAAASLWKNDEGNVDGFITSVVKAGGIPILVWSLNRSIVFADSEDFKIRQPLGILLLIALIPQLQKNGNLTFKQPLPPCDDGKMSVPFNQVHFES